MTLCVSFLAKPISLVERCYCRSTVSNLPRGFIRELRFIHTPNCPFQVMWVLHPTSVSGSRIELPLNHQTGFLFIGHFSPSISTRWQAREKSCVHTHAPLSLSHTCSGEKVGFFSRPKVALPGSELAECEKIYPGFWNWIQSYWSSNHAAGFNLHQ